MNCRNSRQDRIAANSKYGGITWMLRSMLARLISGGIISIFRLLFREARVENSTPTTSLNGKPAYLAIREAGAAIRLMLDSHISGLLVINAGRLVDILTEGNFGIRRAPQMHKRPGLAVQLLANKSWGQFPPRPDRIWSQPVEGWSWYVHKLCSNARHKFPMPLSMRAFEPR